MQVDKSLHKKLNFKPLASIGIDLMGGDHPPHSLFDAVIQAAATIGPDYSLQVFLNQATLEWIQAKKVKLDRSISFHIADQIIEMNDEPLTSIRHKKNSSIVMGLKALKKKTLDAFVSLGNTGALIAGSALILPLLPQVKRPALLAILPSSIGRISLLDVGGNISYKAKNLVQYAVMGACFQRVHFGISFPNVALLNVGIESKKGTAEHKLAYEMLTELSQKKYQLKFIGNLEGFEIFDGNAEVIVTDGFTGNILLKSAEGIASYMIDFLKQTQPSQPLNEIEAKFSTENHPGAILLGVEGVVVKCHGSSSSKALLNGIKASADYVKKKLIPNLRKELEGVG